MNKITSKSIILITVVLMDLLAGMEFDLFVPSFPELQSQFHLSPFFVESLLSVNFLGYCISLFIVGGLSDRYGRKPIILSGLIIFIIGSFSCLAETSYFFLLIGRFLQGIGIAAPSILSFLIIADKYTLKKQQFYMTLLNGVMNISVAVAPVLGSYIALYFNWQGNFITLLLLSLLIFFMTLIFIPYQPLPNEHKEESTFNGYLSLCKESSLFLLMANIIFMFIPYWIFVGMSPLLYIKSLRVGLAHFGYYQGVLALIFALGSLLFGMVIHYFKTRKMLQFASIIYIISLISMGLMTVWNSTNPLFITVAFIPFIISQIIPGNLLGPICLNLIQNAKGRVSAILQGFRLIFSALCLEIAGYFYQDSFRNIGILISFFILLVIVTHFFVLRNNKIMEDTYPK